MGATRDIAQLLLQVDASVALAQRNLGALAQTVDGQTSRMDQSLGRVDKAFTRMSTSAASSAEVFIQGRRAADDLIGAIDPLYAAQTRYDRELERAQALMRQGQLTTAEFAKVQAGLKAQLDDQVGLYGGVAKGVGNARIAQMELMHVVRGSVDQYASGASIMQVFAVHTGMLAQAASLSAQGEGKFSQFLQGPWMLAVTAGVAIIGSLIAKHHDAGTSVDELVDKMRQQHAEALNEKAAHEVWARSIDGVREAQSKLRDELEKSLKVEVLDEREALQTAESRLKEQQSTLAKDRKELDRRIGEHKSIQGQLQNPDLDPGAASDLQTKLARVDARIRFLQGEVKSLTSDVVDSQKTIADAQQKIAARTAGYATDATKAIGDAFTALKGNIQSVDHDLATRTRLAQSAAQTLAALEVAQKAAEDGARAGIVGQSQTLERKVSSLVNSLVAGKTGPAAFAAEVRKMADALERAASAAEKAKHSTGGLPKVTLGEVKGLINSNFDVFPENSHQLTEGKHAKNSYHYAGQAIDFVPKGGMQSLTKDQIRAVIESAGIKILELLGPGDPGHSDHFHVAFAKQRLGPDQIAAAQDRRTQIAARAEQKSQVDEDGFARQSAQLDADTLSARRQLVAGYDTQADLQLEEIEAQRQARQAAIQKQLDAKQITAEQAKELSMQADNAAAAQSAVVAYRRYVQGLGQLEQNVQQQLGFQLDDLRFADEMAVSQSDHRRIQLQILDITYAQRKDELEYQLMLLKRNKDFATSAALQAEAAKIQAQINRLPQDQAHDRSRVEQGTLSPLEEWAKSVPHDAAAITEALQSIEARGLDSLASSITDVITGTKSLGAAFKDISQQIIGDIIQMTIRMLIFRAISGIFGGGSSFSTPGGSGGSFVPFASAHGNIFSAGRPVPHRNGGIVDRLSYFPMRGGGVGSMAEDGPEAIMPLGRDSSGRLGVRVARAPRVAAPQLGRAENAPIELIIRSAPSKDAWAQIDQIAATRAGQGVKISVKHTNDTIAQLRRPKLTGA